MTDTTIAPATSSPSPLSEYVGGCSGSLRKYAEADFLKATKFSPAFKIPCRETEL